jgi:protein-disulfide isomerase
MAQPSAERKAPPAPPKDVLGSRDVLAMIGDTAVTDAMIEERAGDRLARLKAEEYQIKRQVLDEFILLTLMEKEAKARGISVDELRKTEIDAKIQPVTEDAKRAVYESNPQQFQGRPEAEALAQIEGNLKRVREAEARRRFMEALRSKNPVRVFMSPPRVAIDTRNEPYKGPENAEITLVVFSDYQCPYCSRLEPALKQIQQKYGNKVKTVFRDFPLSQIHPNAIKSAEAAGCASEQGKFWEMHDKMFSDQRALAPTALKRSAAEVGMDEGKFAECLDSGRKAVEWQRDMRDGQRYGVTGTPSVFINGRMFRGPSTVESLSAVIDEELSMKTTK